MDLHNNSSERFVCDVGNPECAPKMLQSTKLCTEGELAIPILSLSVKNIYNVIDICKVDYQNKSFSSVCMIKAVGVLTKAVKILQFIGLAIGPIIKQW